ncbi:MAG TPA: cyclic nucleotide-binding domain-containing protein [Candidatus Dormibacteraeota bacterium]|nr:cyclic nucleotide-binding domain-containing protein [Candidatus Dormibacteraeota bacterium]
MRVASADAARIAALRAARQLASYPDKRLQDLLLYFDEVTLPAGRLVAQEGERCSQFVVVMCGRLQATANGARSHTLVAGDSVGWKAMWERSSNETSVVVADDARLLVMSHAQFRAVKAMAEPAA